MSDNQDKHLSPHDPEQGPQGGYILGEWNCEPPHPAAQGANWPTGDQIIATLDVAQARQVAMDIMESAARAEADALVLRFLKDRIGIPIDKAGQVMAGLPRVPPPA